MTKRKVEFPPNGRRIFAAPEDIVATWRMYSTIIPAQYALGTADHESSFTLNEVDTEPSGFMSYGIFQLSGEEAASAYCDDTDDLFILKESCRVLATIAEERFDAIKAVGRPCYDLWAYLALAHNEGLHAALKSIEKYGFSWDDWKARNGAKLANMCRYGDDCITGGKAWRPEFEIKKAVIV